VTAFTFSDSGSVLWQCFKSYICSEYVIVMQKNNEKTTAFYWGCSRVWMG